MKEKINKAIDKVFEIPYVGIIVTILAFYLPILLIGKLAGALGANFVGEYAVRLIVGAVLAALIYWLRGDRMYACGFKKYGFKGFLCIMPVIVIATCVVGFQILKGSHDSVESVVYPLILAFEAGFVEELMVRGLPLGNLIWKADSFKSVMKLVIFSSVVFGYLHMGNVLRTGDVISGLTQSTGAAFAGVFFAAVYLRTGSIIPGIIGHFLWDFMTMFAMNTLSADNAEIYTQAADTTYSNTQLIAGQVGFMVFEAIFWTIIILVLLRKSKREEIVKNFAKA